MSWSSFGGDITEVQNSTTPANSQCCGGEPTMEVFTKHYELHYQQKKV
jgi:hypothetical protein